MIKMIKRKRLEKDEEEEEGEENRCFIKIYDPNGNVIEINILFMYANM